MIFASFEFLFLFLPIFFVVYYLTPVRLRNWPILILSWAFYAWWRVDFLALLVCVTVLHLPDLAHDGQCWGWAPRSAKYWLQAGLVGNLGVLCLLSNMPISVCELA